MDPLLDHDLLKFRSVVLGLSGFVGFLIGLFDIVVKRSIEELLDTLVSMAVDSGHCNLLIIAITEGSYDALGVIINLASSRNTNSHLIKIEEVKTGKSEGSLIPCCLADTPTILVRSVQKVSGDLDVTVVLRGDLVIRSLDPDLEFTEIEDVVRDDSDVHHFGPLSPALS